MKNRFFLILIICVIAINSAAQPTNIKFQHVSLENGLSQTNVRCILQDTRGFVWFGTSDGLNKYDGYNINVYKKKFGKDR